RLGVGWAACEWVRATLGVPNPWALSAYSQIELLPLAPLAGLGGPRGAPALAPERPWWSAAALAALLAAALGYGARELGREHGVGAPLQVAVIQGGIARPDRDAARDAATSRAELERYLALTEEAVAAARPDLVVWPEGALDFSPSEATQRTLRLRDASRALAPDLMLRG